MIDLLVEELGLAPWIANYLILPLLIFCARILDVSAGTVRVVFIMQGNKRLAPLVGFVESFIWLIAISQIVRNIDNIISYVAFSGGFAAGTFVGLYIEEKLAIGKVLVRVITKIEGTELINYLIENDYYFTNVPAEGRYGKVNVIFFVIQRDRLKPIVDAIKQFNPKAFYTIESVRAASEHHFADTKKSFTFFRYLSLKRR